MARPKGSPNKPRDIADSGPSRCQVCGSTRRTPYQGSPTIHATPGVHQGAPYTRIEIRRTQCVDCGQFRFDRDFIYEPDGPGEEIP